MAEIKRTPLYELQKERGARFVDFAGWELPVQFEGVVKEHEAVRERAGLFDVSHMGEVRISGPEALDAVQKIITNNAAKLVDGKAQYTVMCVDDGGIVDDLIVYRESGESFFICVNASRRQDDLAHMRETVAGLDCTIDDISDDYAQLALQGPLACEILGAATDVDAAAMAPFTWVDATVGGADNIRIAKTGYTGEDGVELYIPAASAPAVFKAIEEVGKSRGLAHCGLGSRDTLRMEVKFPLYGNDIDLDHNPYEAGLGWVVKLKKGDFRGRDALAAIKAEGPMRRLIGFKMKERGIPRPGYVLQKDGEGIGVVTSGTHSPSLKEPIGLGYLPADSSEVGTTFDVEIRGKAVAAEVVKTPFYSKS